MPDTPVDELWRRWVDARDPQARERLVIHYSPLVKFVVGRLRSRLPAHVDPGDLTSEGLIGLLDAMDRFQPDRGLQFQTFAIPRIRGAIMDGLRSSDWMPRGARDRLRAVDRTEDVLAQSLGRPPTAEEVAFELSTDASAVRRTAEDRARSTAVPLEDHLDEAPSSADTLLDDDDLPEAVVDALRSLPERDQIVLALYYWERLTLVDIGSALGVSESRVSQLHSRATKRLREALESAARH